MNEETLFFEALSRSPEERVPFLAKACFGNPELRAAVEALLYAHEKSGHILDSPPVDLQATIVGGSNPHSSGETVDQWARPDGAPPGDPCTETMESKPQCETHILIAGRYTLSEKIGEGGMGTVYRAEQSQPVKRQVALKLIKVGMDSRSVLARFDAERQALAIMDHPSIARVYDGGVTEAGQPFFVMEFVQGVPITDYCDRNRLSLDARLHLFVAVCQAVQHAHQKGIIHRDLKPSNVMVTEVDGRPTPKVIDFGVAKATELSLTDQSLGDTGAIVGTPTYMSPEQADPTTQDIDTRTDIYALGVILYELLTGSTPLDAAQFKRGALLEMLRMVREVDPSKPSTKVSTADALPSIAANRGIDPEHLKRELRGDLDWIVMKSLEKDRTRRYETASGFGADILRHLASEPVLAAPPSRSYRLRKFARKHRVGVIAASLVLLALVAGVTGTTWGLFEARRSADGERRAKLDAQKNEKKALAAADREKKAKETVEDVLGFVEKNVFAAARPKGQDGGLGYDVTMADAIAAALPSIETRFRNKPLTEARLRRTIGLSFHDLGKPEIATQQLEAARTLYTRELGPDHLDTLVSMSYLARSYVALDRLAEALKLGEETLALYMAKLGPDHPNTLRSTMTLAIIYDLLGRRAESLKLDEETLALCTAKLGPDHPDTLAIINNLALDYDELGRNAEALKLHEKGLALSRAKLGPDHPDTLRSMGNLANSYERLGRYDEAAQLQEETLALKKAGLGPDHPSTLLSISGLAASYERLGRKAEALKLREEAMALCKTGRRSDHRLTLLSMNGLANSYLVLGRNAEELKLREEALTLSRAKLGPDHPDTLLSMRNLAGSYAALARHVEAIKLFEETLALEKSRLGPEDRATLWSMNGLARSYAALARHVEAVKLFEETLAIQKSKLEPEHPNMLASLDGLANAYIALDRKAEALELPGGALALRKAKLGPAHPDTLASLNGLANAYIALDRKAEALKLGEEALALCRAKFGPDHLETIGSLERLGGTYYSLGRHPEELKCFEEVLALRKAKQGPLDPATLGTMHNLANTYSKLDRQADERKLRQEREEAKRSHDFKLREEALAIQTAKLRATINLTESYMVAGRTSEARALLKAYPSPGPKHSFYILWVAALEVWFGFDEDLIAARVRILATFAGTEDANTADHVARACSLLPFLDTAELEATIALSRRSLNRGNDHKFQAFFLMGLGVAEYRAGHFAEAEATLVAAMERQKSHPDVVGRNNQNLAGTSSFYRAMALFRLGKAAEARELATEAAATMRPLPRDEKNPTADGADANDLILWLAFKEAKALIGFDVPPAAAPKPDGK